jgi:IS5 family transposase
VDQANPGIDIKHQGKFKSLTEQEKKMLKRRQAIEPIIGHLKADHRMNRCHLKGADGGSLHAVLCAAGYNIRWLLRMIVKKGLSLFLRLLQAAGWTDFSDLQRKLRGIFTVNPNKSGFMKWVMG